MYFSTSSRNINRFKTEIIKSNLPRLSIEKQNINKNIKSIFSTSKKVVSPTRLFRKKTKTFSDRKTSSMNPNALTEQNSDEDNIDYILKNLLSEKYTYEERINGNRSRNDILVLKHCTENVKFFQELYFSTQSEEIHMKCCRYMTNRYLEKNEVLFFEGSVGTSFFIILKGEVAVCKYLLPGKMFEKKNIEPQKRTNKNSRKNSIESQKSITSKENYKLDINELENMIIKNSDEPNLNYTNIKRSSKLIKNKNNNNNSTPKNKNKAGDSIFKNSKNNNNFNNNNININEELSEWDNYLNSKNLFEVKILSEGSSFGELSLIHNKPRAATIVAKSECYLAVLEKNHFNHTLMEQEQKKLYNHIEFLSSMKLFEGWSQNDVKNLFLNTTNKELKRNQILFEKDSVPESVFIVQSGEFKFVKTIVLEKIANKLGKRTKNKTIANFFRGEKEKELTFDVCLAGPGEIIGEEEVILDQKREFTVICSSQKGVLFNLPKKEFFKRIWNNQRSKELILSSIEEKKNWRDERISSFKQNFLKSHKDFKDERNFERWKEEKEEINNDFKDFFPSLSTTPYGGTQNLFESLKDFLSKVKKINPKMTSEQIKGKLLISVHKSGIKSTHSRSSFLDHIDLELFSKTPKTGIESDRLNTKKPWYINEFSEYEEFKEKERDRSLKTIVMPIESSNPHTYLLRDHKNSDYFNESLKKDKFSEKLSCKKQSSLDFKDRTRNNFNSLKKESNNQKLDNIYELNQIKKRFFQTLNNSSNSQEKDFLPLKYKSDKIIQEFQRKAHHKNFSSSSDKGTDFLSYNFTTTKENNDFSIESFQKVVFGNKKRIKFF